jgi:hypothetical protein
MYVMPAEENGDDSYEPPPAEQEMRTVHPALPFARGEYIGEVTPPFLKHREGQWLLPESPLLAFRLTSKQVIQVLPDNGSRLVWLSHPRQKGIFPKSGILKTGRNK